MTDVAKLLYLFRRLQVPVTFHGQPAYFTAAGRRYFYDNKEELLRVENIK